MFTLFFEHKMLFYDSLCCHHFCIYPFSYLLWFPRCYQTTSHFLITVGFLFVKEEDDSLFDKGEVNFWAEKLTHVRQLSKHLLHLISVTHLTLPDHGELNHLSRTALDQAQRTEHLLGALPPVPEFSRTPEFTRLAIQKERLSVCLKILNLLKPDDTCKNENLEK